MSGRENAVMLSRLERETDVLLDEEDTEIAAFGEFHDCSFDFGDHVGLNALGRFVEDEDLGLGDQGASDGKLLSLPTGEKSRATVEERGECGKQIQCLCDECLSAFAPVGDHPKILGSCQLSERLLALGYVGKSASDAGARP